MSTKLLTGRQARWSMFLSEFDFVITHRPGIRNGKADLLSRRADYEDTLKENKMNSFKQLSQPSQILAATETNSQNIVLDRIKNALESADNLSKEIEKNPFMTQKEGILLYKEMIYVPTEEL